MKMEPLKALMDWAEDKLTWEDIRHIHFLCEKAIGHYTTEEEMYQAVLDKFNNEKN